MRSAHRDNTPWWSLRLDKLRKDARKSWNIAKAIGSPWDWENPKKDQRAHKEAIRSAKRESLRRYSQEIESIPEAARIQKILRKDPMPADGSFRTSTGEFTESWREEIEVMLGKHFPGYTLTDGWVDWLCPRGGHGDRNWTTAAGIVTPARGSGASSRTRWRE